MEVKTFVKVLNGEFYTGVPDSLLSPLCDYLMDIYGKDPRHHVIAANEGNCVALAAGYYLSTEKIPIIYMQNSGAGNIVNPVTSLLNDKVYAIPCIFVVGWRGEPGVYDEPQHIYQGEITLKLLEDLDIRTFVIEKRTTEEELQSTMNECQDILKRGKSVAFVVKKDAFSYENKRVYQNRFNLCREEVIEHIVKIAKDSPIISTTGKISRELFEIREKRGESHQYDFLTVGSMGHSSSIALGIAVNKPREKVWCIDGDGAVLMHMGAMPVIAECNPDNLVHIVINNGAHESVGGVPTAALELELSEIANNCGYQNAISVDNLEALDEALQEAQKRKALSFIEVKCAMGSRKDLGRPSTTAVENKRNFMRAIKVLDSEKFSIKNLLAEKVQKY